MKCIKERCYSPVACGGFGYCRELNFQPYSPRDDFNKSVNAAYDAIKERVANGGPGWEPKSGADDNQ